MNADERGTEQPGRCDRCGREFSEGTDGRTVLRRADGTTQFTRGLCNRCFNAVSRVMTERVPGSYRPEDMMTQDCELCRTLGDIVKALKPETLRYGDLLEATEALKTALAAHQERAHGASGYRDDDPLGGADILTEGDPK